jgi:hypothetical protein
MKFRTYDSDGNLTYESYIEFIHKADVPTHGSISIEIGPDRWLSFVTSEWLVPYVDNHPVHHKNSWSHHR